MTSLATAAREGNKPLTVEIKGQKAGEVSVDIVATGVCHTRAYTLSGLYSEGKFSAILAHEGVGIVWKIGAGVTPVKPGDHGIPLFGLLDLLPRRCIDEIAATKECRIWPDTTVVIFDLGSMGLSVIQSARVVNADKITGVDLNPSKTGTAKTGEMTYSSTSTRSTGTTWCRPFATLPMVEPTFHSNFFNVETILQALECCHRG